MVENNKNNFRSELSVAKGYGSAKNGTKTWIAQRLTAVALIFLSIWFVCLLMQAITGTEIKDLAKSPFNAVTFLLFIIVGLYHGMLGVKEIIEDYIHCRCVKVTSLIVLHFLTVFTGVLGTFSVIMFHFSIFA